MLSIVHADKIEHLKLLLVYKAYRDTRNIKEDH